jgi:glycerol-3-phosphate acyltransferase PlsX
MQDGQSYMRGKVNHSRPRIGIDLLGSDTAPEKFFASVEDFYDECRDEVDFVVFGTPAMLSRKFSSIATKEIITMEENPLVAVRRKKEASLCVGMRMLQKRELDAFVSAGNTGALIASAKMRLSMLPGIARPALLALMPTQKKEIAVLDVGANITYKVEHLLQFASMGIAYQKSRGILHPTVGLLNIGTEQKKGTPELQEAYKMLHTLKQNDQASPVFLGNIEGRDVFKGDIDVLVTDGFTGNVFLKTAEGIASFILDQLQDKVSTDAPLFLKETLGALHHRLHHTDFPGAIICGVDGIVVKCHGNATPAALISSIKGAIRLTQHHFLDKIKTQLGATSCKKFF